MAACIYISTYLKSRKQFISELSPSWLCNNARAWDTRRIQVVSLNAVVIAVITGCANR